MKKVVSLFMAVIMIFSIAVPTFAVSAADAAQPAVVSSADAATTTDGVFSDIIGSITDFFNKAIETIVDFFRWLFGMKDDAADYKIIFDTDGGTSVSEMVVTEGEKIPSPAIPRKTGYTFIGWSPALPETMPSYDLEVKALWSINKYTLSFDSNGGTEVDPIVQNYGSEIVAPADPVRSGYQFVCWQVWNSESKAWVSVDLPKYMPAQSISYRALWIDKTYTITFVDGKGGVLHTITAKYGDSITAMHPEDPSIEGHTFVGWDKIVPTTMPARDTTITAIWKENYYTVSFVANGKTLVTYTEKYGTVIDIPAAPALEGHEFVGWTGSNGNEVAVSSTIKGDFTYYAKYKKLSYNVTWNINGKTAVESYEYGAAINTPTVVAEKGYEFTGWDKTVPLSMPAKALTFTAQFEAKDYTITFNTDGGSAIASITQKYGTTVSKPSNPTKEGYAFTGWDKTVPQTMPAENMTITAQWSINQYTITFENTGDVAYESITQDYGTAIAAVEKPVKEGHTFKGWDKIIPSKMPAENMTITALWEVNKYTITFDTLGGSAVASITQDYATEITAPEVPTKSDYEFIGWAAVTSPSVDDKIDLPETMPAGDITYYAIWRGAEKTVVFNANTGKYATADQYTTTTKHTRTIRNGDNLTEYLNGDYEIDGVVFQQPAKDGYAILYWSTDSTFKSDMSNKVPEVLDLDKNTESVEYFAQWAKTYTITLKDGATNKVLKTATLPTGQSLADFYETPAKDGYTFSYWAEDAKGETKANPFTTMPGKDVTYYAIWETNEYVMSFDANGGTFGEAADGSAIESPYTFTAKYKASITKLIPADPTREGYTFMGWTTKETVTEEDTAEKLPTTMPLDGAYYYAMWQINSYYAEYYIVDGETETLYTYDVTVEDVTSTKTAKYAVEYNAEITVPEVDPAKEGYQFMGWYDTKDEEGGSNVKDMKMPASGVKLYARFEKTYSFKFANCEGVNTITAVCGTDIASQLKALAPAKEGHSFAKWIGSDGKEYATNAAIAAAYPTMPKKNITFTAEWTVNTYKVIFIANGGTSVSAIEQQYNTPIVAPENPTKTGYTFAGWSPAVPTLMPAGGATCVAQWTINQYTISFDTDGGSAVDSITQDYNSSVTAPAVPTKYGYTFNGWIDEDGNKVNVPSVMPAKDMTLTATWIEGNFSAKFYIEKGDETAFETLAFDLNEEIEAPLVNPSKTGYTFKGWSTDGVTVLDDLGKMLSEGTEFYAVWEANKITVEFIDLDGNSLGKIDQTCDSGYKFPAYAPTKDGHTLVWKNGSAVITADDKVPCLADGTELTYKADWQINQYTITFDSDGGSDVAAITADYETALAEPQAPTKEGYTFIGWTEDGAAFEWVVETEDAEGNTVKEAAKLLGAAANALSIPPGEYVRKNETQRN